MSVALAVGLVALGVLIGGVAGLLGIGGGALMVPVLVVLAGLSQTEAAATSLAVIVPTSLMASRSLAKHGVGDLRRAIALGCVGALGSVAGALVALSLPETALRFTFAAFLAVIGARLLRDALRMRSQPA